MHLIHQVYKPLTDLAINRVWKWAILIGCANSFLRYCYTTNTHCWHLSRQTKILIFCFLFTETWKIELFPFLNGNKWNILRCAWETIIFILFLYIRVGGEGLTCPEKSTFHNFRNSRNCYQLMLKLTFIGLKLNSYFVLTVWWKSSISYQAKNWLKNLWCAVNLWFLLQKKLT